MSHFFLQFNLPIVTNLGGCHCNHCYQFSWTTIAKLKLFFTWLAFFCLWLGERSSCGFGHGVSLVESSKLAWWWQFRDIIAKLDCRPPACGTASSSILAIEGLPVLDLVGKWQLSRGTKKETEVLTSFAATQCTTKWQAKTAYVILGSKERVYAVYGHWWAFNTKLTFVSTELKTSIWKYMDIGW